MNRITTRRRDTKVVIEKVYFNDIKTTKRSKAFYKAIRYEKGKPTVFSLMTVIKGK